MVANTSSWEALSAQLTQASSSKGRRVLDASVAEGWRLLERALAAGVLPSGVLVGERVSSRPRPDEVRVLTKLRAAGVSCLTAPQDALEAHTAGRTFGDLVGLVPMFDPGLSALLQTLSPVERHPGLSLLVGVQVLDPGNIGALTRTAHALGAGGAVWVGGTDPRHPKALRASMGSCFRLPWTHCNLAPEVVVQRLRATGWTSYATVTRGGTLLESEFSGRSAIWMGGEAHGLPPAVVAACDAQVRIAMREEVDSLSINAAAAVIMSRAFSS